MYDNSNLTMYGGDIGELNLYPNSTATLRGGAVFELWVDPNSTGWAKLYATIEHIDHFPDSGGYITVMGNWLDNSQPFNISLRNGLETINHIQFVPEPATLAFLALGGLAALRRRSG